jgi:GDP-L-fucose synthase
MVGSAIQRKLTELGYENCFGRTSNELDLRFQDQVIEFFERERPEYVFLTAAKVGGILANNEFRAEFLYDNLMIEANIIHASFLSGVKKLLFLGSSCIYPRNAPQPLKEEYLLTGVLEHTNEPYAIAKIAGIKLCDAYRAQYGCNFISAMPTNLYGPNDNYDLQGSHVLPALMRKFHGAKKNGEKEVLLWGSGAPLREFMHVDDLGEACIFLMDTYNKPGFINVGSGEEISITNLAQLVKEIIGFKGNIKYDNTKPDGTPRKLMDSSRINNMGWHAKIHLEKGIRNVYNALSNQKWY